MKKVLSFLLSVCMLATLCGCSMFSSGESDATQFGDLKITDALTHVAPEGAAARYAFTSGADPENVQFFKDEYDVNYKETINIIYGDEEDQAIAMYEYIVFESEDDAKKFNDLNSQGGFESPYTVEGNVMVSESSKEDVQNLMDANKNYGDFDLTASSFAAWWKDVNLFMEFKGN